MAVERRPALQPEVDGLGGGIRVPAIVKWPGRIRAGSVSDQPAITFDWSASILDLARANDIAVVLAAIPPSRKLFWRGDLDPRPQIRELNEWLRGLAFSRGLTFVDYGAVLADADGGMRADLGNDGVHPNRLGYTRMRPMAERAVAEAVERADAPAAGHVTVARREVAPPPGRRIGLCDACAASRSHSAHATPDTAHHFARVERGGADRALAGGATKRYVRARNAAS